MTMYDDMSNDSIIILKIMLICKKIKYRNSSEKKNDIL